MALNFRQRETPDAFEASLALLENIDKTFELIDVEVVEVPSDPFVSKIAASILTFRRIGSFLPR